MILQTSGDIFDSPADILVNPVNCVGVMGAGLARQFAAQFPEIMAPYKRACDTGRMETQRVFAVKTNGAKVVWCVMSKCHWREVSTLGIVEASLCEMRHRLLDEADDKVVALPLLGTGLGGLDKKPVRELTYQYLNPLPHTVWLYE